mmetsp:Transcript_8854/g.13395  ORF Transcript_8854/g.13395 Transcript_8854/m.13395 type:complete len:452 (-) Transcript_8854:292-1647(-)
MAFRKPRFDLVPTNREGSIGRQRDELMSTITGSIKPSNYRICMANISDAACELQIDHAIPLETDGAEYVASGDSATKESDAADKIDQDSPSVINHKASARDISMLEPHLAAFRKLLTDSRQEGSITSLNIPPQLMRLVRFFPFKWTPIKRALLRPPGGNEVGVSYRLSLARALHKNNLIATAEFEILEQAVHLNKIGGTHASNGTSRKRGRDQMNIGHELKMAFSRLPLDLGNQSSLRHLRSTVNDYCALTSEPQRDSGDSGVSEENDLPTLDQVSEWALLSFCGVVVSNGIDEPSKESHAFQMESQMVVILTHENAKNKDFTAEVKKRIQRMLEPALIDKLSNLNLLCLARFFSHLDASVAHLLFVHSISACVEGGHGVGLSSLPKLLCSYMSIISRRDTDFSCSKLQHEVQRLLQDYDLATKKERATRFLKILFESAEFIFTEKDNSEE